MGSVWAVLLVQALNAFGDNAVKTIIVALAIGVAANESIGTSMAPLLGVVFAVPYIVLAPVAGFLSDRFSKRSVILWTQVSQLLCYVAFIWALKSPAGVSTLWLCLYLFFPLAIQAAILSPAKSGVMKELVGSAELGKVNGLLQMAMMLGILAGIAVGGEAYARLRDAGKDPWQAAVEPIYYCVGLAVLQILASYLMKRTPGAPELTYKHSLWWEHLGQLGVAYRNRAIGLAVSGMVFFWFMSNSVGTALVGLSKAMHVGNDAAAARELAIVSLVLGVGVMLGALVGGWLCRKHIELGIVPISGLGIAFGLLAAWWLPMGSALAYVALGVVGISGGVFLVPLATFVQDRAPEHERARILAAANLLDCLIGAVIGNGLVGLMAYAGVSPRAQLGVIGIISLGAAIYISRIVPKDMVRFLCLMVVRSIYKVKAVDAARVPATGGVLLLPNHVSYVDALVLSAACNRPVRFVIWDVLYRVWWMNGFLRLFGTVPISTTRAKDAIRTVTEALNQGELVCLFPEGTLTRNGELSELQKGFEIIVRQANAPAVPVWLEGLWGSIFSWKDGRVFTKWPQKLRYPVVVRFGEPLTPKEATTARLLTELETLRDTPRE
jgi:acyl-[acyl-carrier-protein]-phospholipid O-acyltransferase / long-chain-fatty-acid--[acyl-carrier-protein] ligase